MGNLFRLFLLGSLLLSACTAREPEPQNIGVFANTDKGLIELTDYAEQQRRGGYKWAGDRLSPVHRVDLFYVNLPNIEIISSKIFWLPPEETNIDSDFEKTHMPLKIEIKNIKNNLYKILSTELKEKKAGLAALKIVMPLGTPDRIYVMQIAE